MTQHHITKHSLAAVAAGAALPLVRDVTALGRWRLALALLLALVGLGVPAMHYEGETPEELCSMATS
jgi:NO-binding membrane sensor protein with MHYT domain